MKPLYQQEKIWFEKHSQDLQLWMNDKAAFIIKTKALESKLKSDTRRNKDCSITNEQLRFLFENKPKEPVREGANKRGNSSRLTQSFHFFMFEPIFSPVNALNQPI